MRVLGSEPRFSGKVQQALLTLPISLAQKERTLRQGMTKRGSCDRQTEGRQEEGTEERKD